MKKVNFDKMDVQTTIGSKDGVSSSDVSGDCYTCDSQGGDNSGDWCDCDEGGSDEK